MRWPSLNPGEFRHRLRFYTRTISKDAQTGADTSAWSALFVQLAGALNPTEGRKFFDAARFSTERLTTAKINYYAGLDETMQVECQNRRYEILEIRDIQEMHVQQMLALRELE